MYSWGTLTGSNEKFPWFAPGRIFEMGGNWAFENAMRDKENRKRYV
jgi:hypothetical protein